MENPETMHVEIIITATLSAMANTAIRIINLEKDFLSPKDKRFAINNSSFKMIYLTAQKYFFPFALPKIG